MTLANRADLDALHVHLDAQPADWVARLILADLLDDLDDRRGAACQRWMVEHAIRPDRYTYERDAYRSQWSGKPGWHWWRYTDGGDDAPAEPAGALPDARGGLLPTAVASCMPDGEWFYLDRREAETVLARALVAAGEVCNG